MYESIDTTPDFRSPDPEDLSTALQYMNLLLAPYEREAVVQAIDRVSNKPIISFTPTNAVTSAHLAEQLIIEKVEPRALLDIYADIVLFIESEGMLCSEMGMNKLKKWLDSVSGDMAFFLAFPAKMPNWKLLHLGDE